MDPSDALVGLDLESVRRLRQRSGQIESISLTATYDFSFDAYTTAAPGSRPARTVLHETTHAYQMLATSYGHYYLSLRALQTSRVLEILRLLSASRQALKPPLIRQIMAGQPTSSSPQLRLELYVWYLAEMVLLYFEGDADRFGQQLNSIPAFRGRTLRELFSELEPYLVQWRRSQGHDVAVGPLLIVDERAKHDEFQQTVLKLMSVGWGDTLSVLESGARVAEYWQTWPKSLADFDASLTSVSPYTMWIIHARGGNLAADPRSFALTYAALVDLALNPPLLPHHATLRGADEPTSSLNPLLRLLAGIGVTGVGKGLVPPIRDLGRDHEEFVRAVCERNKWPTPTALADVTLQALPEQPPDAVTALYRLSQLFRIQVPSVFLDLDIWRNDEPAAMLFRRSFVHPVIQFDDRNLYLRDKTVLAEFVSNYVLSQYLRQLMVVGNPPVALPIRATPADLEFFTDLVGDILRKASLHQPNLRLVSAPAASHRAPD